MSESHSIRLAFVGDICLAYGLITPGAAKQDMRGFDDIAGVIGDTDVAFANFECCVVDDSLPADIQSHPIGVTPRFADWPIEAGFSVFNIANNHILDCGPESLILTRRFLSENGAAVVGAGPDLTSARETAYVAAKEKTIAFIACGDTSRYYATDHSVGVAPLDEASVTAAIRSAREKADLVILSVHADLEFSFYPAAWRWRLMRRFAEAGADLIIGHHPHVLQGIELHNGSLIAYSLGNFVFTTGGDYMGKRRGVRDSVILCVDISFSGSNPRLSWEIVPTSLEMDGWPRPAKGAEAERIRRHIDHCSDTLADATAIYRHWRRRSAQEARYHLQYLYWRLRRGGPSAAWKALKPLLVWSEHRKWYRGLLTGGRW